MNADKYLKFVGFLNFLGKKYCQYILNPEVWNSPLFYTSYGRVVHWSSSVIPKVVHSKFLDVCSIPSVGQVLLSEHQLFEKESPPGGEWWGWALLGDPIWSWGVSNHGTALWGSEHSAGTGTVRMTLFTSILSAKLCSQYVCSDTELYYSQAVCDGNIFLAWGQDPITSQRLRVYLPLFMWENHYLWENHLYTAPALRNVVIGIYVIFTNCIRYFILCHQLFGKKKIQKTSSATWLWYKCFIHSLQKCDKQERCGLEMWPAAWKAHDRSWETAKWISALQLNA